MGDYIAVPIHERGFSPLAQIPFIVNASSHYPNVEPIVGVEFSPMWCGDGYSGTYKRQNARAARKDGEGWRMIGPASIGDSCWYQTYKDTGVLHVWKDASFEEMIKWYMHPRGWHHYHYIREDGGSEVRAVTAAEWAELGLDVPPNKEWDTPPAREWADTVDTTPAQYKGLSAREMADYFCYDCRFYNFSDSGFLDCANKKNKKCDLHWRTIIHGKENFVAALAGWREKYQEFSPDQAAIYPHFLCGDEYNVITENWNDRVMMHHYQESGFIQQWSNWKDQQYEYYMRPSHYVDGVDVFDLRA